MPVPALITLAASESVKSLVKPGFSKFIEPQLDSINNWFKERKLNRKIDLFESEFTEYLGSVYNATQFMNILIFPNEQIPLDEFYEPLYITTSNNKETYKIDRRTNINFLAEYKRVIISDAAGMGKSTIMKWITRQCVMNFLGIPILIELKKITPLNTIIQEIFIQFGQLGSELDATFITKLLSIGKFIIIFDGFDEIAQDDISFVTTEISNFVNKAAQNYFILTSRPDPILSAFGSFKGFHIKPLTPTQYNSIIRKCDKYSPEPVGEELIKDLQERGKDIIDFLTNPFLVTLLYNCYVYNKNIPVNKSSFYDEIYTALFKRHDLSKDKFERLKRSGLDIYTFRLVLRKLAFNSAKAGIVDFSEDTLISAIKNVQESLPGLPQFSALSFYEDIIKQVPLMVREGLHIKWSHKSLQDYFAAESICNSEHKAKFVVNIFEANTFYRNANLFDFLVELDYGLIREHILYDILIDFRNFVQQIRECNHSLSEDRILLWASILFNADILLSKATDPSKVSYTKLAEVSRTAVGGFGSWYITLNGQKTMVIVPGGKLDNLFYMIKHKKKEDIFFPEDNRILGHKAPFNLNLNFQDDIVSLSSREVLSNQDESFQENLDKFLSSNANDLRLDYYKSMIVLRDIEEQRSKQAHEDAQSF